MKFLPALAFVALVTVAVSAPADASHYYLRDIGERFSSLQLEEFARFGFRTTEDVLRNVDTVEDRETLSFATGIPEAELIEVARMCEFLQLEGIGPKAFDLLRATGVVDVADLAGRDAEELLAEIVVVNSVEQITGVDPDVDLVHHWIASASEVPIRVAY